MSWAEIKKVNGDLSKTLDQLINEKFAALATVGRAVFTADGTFVVPANVNKVYITACGGGGGGGRTTSGSNNYGGGGGGGGGALIRREMYNVTPGQSIPITIGAGGVNGNPSTAGGATIIGSLVTLPGGSPGGAGGSGGAPGGGGSAGNVNAGAGGSGGGSFGVNGGFTYVSSVGGFGHPSGSVGSTYPSGGGGGGGGSLGCGGKPASYGGGGNGAGGAGTTNGTSGGSGMVIIEWGAII